MPAADWHRAALLAGPAPPSPYLPTAALFATPQASDRPASASGTGLRPRVARRVARPAPVAWPCGCRACGRKGWPGAVRRAGYHRVASQVEMPEVPFGFTRHRCRQPPGSSAGRWAALPHFATRARPGARSRGLRALVGRPEVSRTFDRHTAVPISPRRGDLLLHRIEGGASVLCPDAPLPVATADRPWCGAMVAGWKPRR